MNMAARAGSWSRSFRDEEVFVGVPLGRLRALVRRKRNLRRLLRALVFVAVGWGLGMLSWLL